MDQLGVSPNHLMCIRCGTYYNGYKLAGKLEDHNYIQHEWKRYLSREHTDVQNLTCFTCGGRQICHQIPEKVVVHSSVVIDETQLYELKKKLQDCGSELSRCFNVMGALTTKIEKDNKDVLDRIEKSNIDLRAKITEDVIDILVHHKELKETNGMLTELPFNE